MPGARRNASAITVAASSSGLRAAQGSVRRLAGRRADGGNDYGIIHGMRYF